MMAWCGGEQKHWGQYLTLYFGLGLLRHASQLPVRESVRRAASLSSLPSLRPNREGETR